MSKDKFWADAKDLVLEVPVWTLVREKATGEIVHSFTRHDEKRVAVPWGAW